MRNGSDSTRARTAEMMEPLRNDITALKRDLTALVGGRFGAVTDRTRETIARAGTSVKKLAERTREKADVIHGRLGEAAGARPITTIALAAAAGAIGAKMAGWMWRQSVRRSEK